MKKLNRLARTLYQKLETALSGFDEVGDGAWITDNKNRILALSASLTHLKEPRLPKGYEAPRVFELAQELVEQSDGAISAETVRLTRTFSLTFAEYDFLPTALLLNLLRMLLKITEEPQTYLPLAPGCVKTLILFSDLDFDGLRKDCLKQEDVLLRDETYADSDAPSKNVYRLRAARLARRSGKSEEEVCAMALAQNDVTDALFGAGEELLCQRLALRAPRKASLPLYLLAGFLPAAILCGLLGVFGLPYALLSSVPASVLSFRLLHRCLLRRTAPRRVLRLKEPSEKKTAVTLTVLLSDENSVQKALGTLEEYAAGNPLKHGVYLLLADLKESKTPASKEDEPVLAAIETGLNRLTHEHGNRFAAIVRTRQPYEKSFIGRERKRGALEDLVQFLTGGAVSFRLAVHPELLEGVAYLCTLDADTVLPPGSVRRLLCAAAHPANKSYGLIQPHIGTLPHATTPFARLFASFDGLNTYDAPARDAFFDVFASGSFCGKGLFSVSVYRERVSGRIRPNTVLSHDLLEGELLGALAANDVTFFDAFPQNPLAFYKRRERWLRGDWLLLRWLFKPLPALSKWKIFWNLLLSLFPVGVFLQVCAGFFASPLALLPPLAALLFPLWEVYADALRFDREKHLFADKRGDRFDRVAATLVTALFLPFDAFDSLRAILRTLVRMIRRRRILEWTPFAASAARGGLARNGFFFLPGVLFGLLPLACALIARVNIPAAIALSLAWSTLPFASYLLGKETPAQKETLSPDETHDLRLLAMRTLRFFDDALRENGFLMPDHLQTRPSYRYAPRTSPTNLGFALLSAVCGSALNAYAPSDALDLLRRQTERITRLPRRNGHLFNWISLKTGKPLTPYVSSVDSGNYAAALAVVIGALPGMKRHVLTENEVCRALADVIEACLDEAEEDFRTHLQEYVRLFAAAEGKSAITLARRFLSDRILESCDAARFAVRCIKGWLRDAESLRFSDGLLALFDAQDEFNLRPFRRFLARFPLSPADVLSEPDLEETLRCLVWSAGRERYRALLDRVRTEYGRIYRYAFSLNESSAALERVLRTQLEETDFACLYDTKKELLRIGMDTEKPGKQTACYDMLLSEARLTSFMAIALNKVPPRHWFRLSRPFTRYKGEPLCLSWSGTMFEYLMPELFAKPGESSMLARSASLACAAQRAQAGRDGLWGVSESAFCVLDRSGEYRYKAFGVPRTALSAAPFQRVFAPYAALLALDRVPRAAYADVVRLVQAGMVDRYGFYEALDCENKENGIVFSHMAHHQGMGLCALTNFLCGDPIRKAFHANRFVSACDLLWEEKMPPGVLPRRLPVQEKSGLPRDEKTERVFFAPARQDTEVLLLSGAALHALVSSRGQTDIYVDQTYCGNVFLYVCDGKTGSITYLPVRDKTADCRAYFEPGRAAFDKRERDVAWRQEVTVSPDDAVMSIVLTGVNESAVCRQARVWLYLRPVLTDKDAFTAHPCFSDLFLSAGREDDTLLVSDRRTGMTACLCAPAPVRFTGDRCAFIGRGGSLGAPNASFDAGVAESPVTPCMAAEYEILLQPGETKSLRFLLAFGHTAEAAKTAARRVKNPAATDLMRQRAVLHANAFLRQKRLTREEWLLSLRLAALAQSNQTKVKGEKKKDTLWRLSLSERLPLMTVYVDHAHREALSSILRSADYLLARGLRFSLLLVDDAVQDYLDEPFRESEALLACLSARESVRHVRAAEVNPDDLRRLSFAFLSTAGQDALPRAHAPFAPLLPSAKENPYPPSVILPEEGEFDCGYGCFVQNGAAYLIRARTPAPWSNLLVNERFGTLITESGGGFTWCDNAALNKLTPWSGDPVTDTPGELLYLRDDALGRFWSITRDPIDCGDDHTCLFGHGYARYRYNGYGLAQEQTIFVHPSLPVKVWDVTLAGAENRALTLYFACFPVMGETADDARFTDIRAENGMLCAVKDGAYFFLYAPDACYASSEYAFFGDGTLSDPQAVRQGAFCAAEGGKPVLALCVKATARVRLYTGFARDAEELARLRRAIDEGDTSQWLAEVRRTWEERLSRVQIRTPERKLDILFNHWLLYQTLSARLWGRCGFYQAGGAFGFRDQLQDCLSLLYVDPAAVRRHILSCAAHQFAEGDVQHWWHPPRTGVRTHISDDLLFLPLVAARYAAHTGDETVWDEAVPFLEGHAPGERDDLYETAWQSEESGTLFEHCLRAVRLVMRRTGKHGLPLILSGDWNDGLNGLGKNGAGESVWLGWFAYHVISWFLPVVKKKNPSEAERIMAYAKKLVRALNTDGWDGAWFLRAFDDEGKKIGSRENAHCRIDAISQAWAVLSGAAEPDKAQKALESVKRELWDNGLLKLLTPPFSPEDHAGYIGEYLPGVRENGGQYTHAALWTASALAQSGEGETCLALLNMLSPVSHAKDQPSAAHYRLEPYSVPADVYAEENAGRGGWSWYTASSSLYACTVLEDLLGVHKENGSLTLRPHIPAHWREYTVTLNEDGHTTEVTVLNPDGKTEGVPRLTRVEKDEKTVVRAIL